MDEKLKTLFECCIEMRCSECPLYIGIVCYIKGMIKAYIDSLEERIAIMQESMEALERQIGQEELIPISWLEEKLVGHPELPYATTDGIANVISLWNDRHKDKQA